MSVRWPRQPAPAPPRYWPGRRWKRWRPCRPKPIRPSAYYRVGDVVQFPTPDGRGGYAGVVREVGGESLLFDFNHPLAGLPLTFEVHVIGVL